MYLRSIREGAGMHQMRYLCGLSLFAIVLGAAAHILPWAGDGTLLARQAGAPAHFAFGGTAAEIPVEFLDNLILIPARINNSQPSLFLLDSTAATSSIAPARAAELHLTTMSNPVLNLPGVDFPLVALPEIANDYFSLQTGRAYQGTLGRDFFGSVVAEIDYGRKTMRLYDPGAYKYSGNGTVLPLTFSNGEPLIRAKLTLPGQKSREGAFLVNTALDASIVISDKFAEGHHLFSAHLKTITASDPQINGGENIVIGRPKEFQLGAYAVEGAIAAFSPKSPAAGAGADIAGAIGGGILRRFIVVFDFPHQQIILAPNLRLHEIEEEDKSGLTIIAKGPGRKQFEVVAVQPGTPGAHAGVQRGDLIAGIDEEAGADLTLADIRDLLRETGRSHKLSIDRNGQLLQISIQLRRLL